MIHLKNVSKFYGTNLVLDEINGQFNYGHVYGIVGANGAGKTTLFKCICQLTDYLGTIESNFDDIKKHIGYLPTTPYILSRITGNEYLQLFANSRSIKDSSLQKANIFNLPLDQYINTYSTGMMKKLSLQAVLLQKNEIVILDEPFNGVDIQSNMIIVELIHMLKKKNKLVLISSHIFETLDKVCDKIYLLEHNHIEAEYAPHEFEQLNNKLKSYVIDKQIKDLDL